jgi:ubiquinol-cytochrome c reductase cytochrome c1 subunit
MLRPLAIAGLTAVALFVLPADGHAAGEAPAVPARDWSFNGIFGTYDLAAAQRGFQVYKEVCSSCHAMSLVAYRHLEDIGFSEEQVMAIAAQYEVTDGPNEDGEMFARPARPSDSFVSPFPNRQAAMAANGGAYPKDLSVVVDARAGGPDYIHALLTGYRDTAPDGSAPAEGTYYNAYYPGHQIAMAPPLQPDGVAYSDGTAATVDQMAHDVTMFLMWASEPHLAARKQMGIKVILFLIVLAGLLYATKRKIWANVH